MCRALLHELMALQVLRSILAKNNHKMMVGKIRLMNILRVDWPVGLVVRDPDC